MNPSLPAPATLPAMLAELALPPGGYMVVGSGIMSALGLRESHDIDLLVSADVFHHLETTGWHPGHRIERPVLCKDNMDAGMYWDNRLIDQWLPKAVHISGIPYLSLEDLLDWKQRHGRLKDKADIKLIREYLRQR